jgi:hypothetical protein
VIISQLLSCGKSPKCWGEDKNKGIIISSVEIQCFPSVHRDDYVIDSDSAFYTIFDTFCPLPTIDFSKETLLGSMFFLSGCESKFIREVTIHETEPRFVYRLTARSCGFCFSGMSNISWVRVSKLPKDWTVTFIRETK